MDFKVLISSGMKVEKRSKSYKQKAFESKDEGMNYLQDNLHGLGDESEPTAVLLSRIISSGSGRRVSHNSSIGERVQEALSPGNDALEI